MTFKCFKDRAAMEQAAVARISDIVTRPASTPAGLMLTGGQTSLGVYKRLECAGVSAASTLRVMISDERYVPAVSSQHNYSHLKGALDALDVAEDNRLYVNTSLPLDEAAEDYDRQLSAFFRDGGSIGLGLLGLGADGHLASLFTEDDLNRGRGKCAIAVQRPEGPARISVTMSVLRGVEAILFLVAGSDKAGVLDRLRAAPESVLAGRALAGHRAVEVWNCP